MSDGFPPRFPLATVPTPLQEAPRLRAALGGPARCPRLLIKRDDLTGLAFGGNKARKLEFIVADALAQQATVLVTTGAVQSNHARMTAAAARVAGLQVSLVLTSREEQPLVQGNLLLEHLLGAEIHFLPAGADPALAVAENEVEKVAEVVAALEARGERPYVIPVGGSSALGALGYVAGTQELVGQLGTLREKPGWLYYASGSRGTQAGLTLGARLYNAPYQLCGIAVSGGEPDKIERALRIASEAAERLSVAVRLDRASFAHTDQHFIGQGYGIPSEACLKAIRLLAGMEGIFLDPTYTGKAMAGLISHIRQGRIAPEETVVFLHTGGTPALFAHADQLRG